MAHIRNVDFNLLTLAAALYRTRNVSKAAQEMGLTQSAVSHALARLRQHFDDPMFVRTSRGVAPTEFARGIQGEVLSLVQRMELLINRKSAFDPLEARGRITIASTDYLEVGVLSRLLPVVEKEAPHVQISLRPTVGELPKRDLEEGRIDLAVAGFYTDLPEGFFQAKLGSDGFACAVRKDHPRIKTRLSADDYFAAKHALITLQGDFREEMSDPASRKKRAREIVYGSYSFTGLAWTVARTDLVLTAPELLLARYQEYFPLRVLPCPVALDPIDLRMVWHAQTHEDPLRTWFRERFRKISIELLSRGGRL